MEIISRKEAKVKGLDRYFTGKPCKHGHTDQRTTKQATCLTCKKEEYQRNKKTYQSSKKAYYEKNKEDILATQSEYYQNNKERINERCKEYYGNSRDTVLLQEKAYRESWSDERKDYVKQYKKDWVAAIYEEGGEKLMKHRAQRVSITSRRRTKVQSASSDFHKEDIDNIYLEAKILQSKLESCVESDDPYDLIMEVDHVVPISNENVCGLHAPQNLEIVSSIFNKIKSNSFEPYWENHLTGDVQYGN